MHTHLSHRIFRLSLLYFFLILFSVLLLNDNIFLSLFLLYSYIFFIFRIYYTYDNNVFSLSCCRSLGYFIDSTICLDYSYEVSSDGFIHRIYVRPHVFNLFDDDTLWYELDYMLCGIDLSIGYRIYDYNRFIRVNYDIGHLYSLMLMHYNINRKCYNNYLNSLRIRYILLMLLLIFCFIVHYSILFKLG